MARGIDRHKETRERILTAAYNLFVRQGVANTTLGEICRPADVADRTIFNHYPTRQTMLEALADHLLSNMRDAVIEDPAQPLRTRLVTLFDKITNTLAGPSDAQPELRGALIHAIASRGPRNSRLYDTIIELLEDSAERGELTSNHETQVLADIIVGALTAVFAASAAEPTDQLTTKMHGLGLTLAELLTATPPHQNQRADS